jgi:hypothetical protein
LQFDGITGEKLVDFEKAYECKTKWKNINTM